MFELMKQVNRVKAACLCGADVLFCHRMIYGGLSLCHGTGCLITENAQLYAPMSVLYAVLALRG